MTVTPSALTRAAGVCAVAAGAIFIGVQIGHPQLNAKAIQTTDVFIRDQLKLLMAVLALVGITGMYLSQIRKNGVLDAFGTVIQLRGFAYLAGGLLFGIALYRANVLARWASALLAVGGVVSVVLSLMPDAFYRLLAVPNGIAMIGLGYCLWRTTRTTSMQPSADIVPSPRQEASGDVSTDATAAAPPDSRSRV
jgi:hypothetical protein